ncbi:MAG: restriction endonuclease subunit [Frankiales bacterium]|nr:restriction endonuclease subunit [Frankiales bacterium]
MTQLGNFVWSIADQLRGVYKPHQYGNVILPMTILRRLDCVIEPHKEDVLSRAKKIRNPEHLALVLRKEFGLPFYNTSSYTLKTLLSEPDNLRANLVDYISGFSANVADIFERFKLENELITLDEKDRLFLVVRKFSEVDLHPQSLPNAHMGDLFEELIRKFADASNETAGEHFTPRDAIRLMVELLFAPDDEALSSPGVVRTVYDPTAGTGGMLSVADDHLRRLNPDARLVLHGQEFNDQSYAICKADMIAKGQDPANIKVEDTLANDLFAGKRFDYCLSNPPYGVDWKAAEAKVKAERQRDGVKSRFGAGLPDIGDGQMLFLQHLVHKMRPTSDGGGRGAIVLNGSPLFTGDAGSGPSEIRRWLLESDFVDCIVGLPTNMFYNTGIATYVWVLDNSKPAERRGKVLLIDGSSFYSKMRRNLGDKSRELGHADVERILKLYDAAEDGEHSNLFDYWQFGYWKITVERPLRLNFLCSEERVDVALAHALLKQREAELRPILALFGDKLFRDRNLFIDKMKSALREAGVRLDAREMKALLAGLSERDPTAEACVDTRGCPEPDVQLRDTEQVPFPEADQRSCERTVAAFMAAEVLPYVPDAWVDVSKTKVGYEIPFTRHFFSRAPTRSLAEIDSELNTLVAEIVGLLQEIEQ